MKSSEVLPELRNDGWNAYHRAQFEKAIRDLELKVAELKSEIFRDNPQQIEPLGCA